MTSHHVQLSHQHPTQLERTKYASDRGTGSIALLMKRLVDEVGA